MLDGLASCRLRSRPAAAAGLLHFAGSRSPQLRGSLRPAFGHAHSCQNEAKGRPILVQLRVGDGQAVEARLRGFASFGADEGPVGQTLQEELPVVLRVVFLRTTLIGQNVRKERQEEGVGWRHRLAELVGHALHFAKPASFVPRPISDIVKAERHEGERQ